MFLLRHHLFLQSQVKHKGRGIKRNGFVRKYSKAQHLARVAKQCTIFDVDFKRRLRRNLMPPIPNLPAPMLAGGAIAGVIGSAVVMAIVAGVIGSVPVVSLVVLTVVGVVGAMIVAMVVGMIVAAALWGPTMVFWNVSHKMIKRGK